MLTKKQLLAAIAHLPDETTIRALSYNVVLIHQDNDTVSLEIGDPGSDALEGCKTLWTEPNPPPGGFYPSPDLLIEGYITGYYLGRQEEPRDC